jgi:hypothetical protein
MRQFFLLWLSRSDIHVLPHSDAQYIFSFCSSCRIIFSEEQISYLTHKFKIDKVVLIRRKTETGRQTRNVWRQSPLRRSG